MSALELRDLIRDTRHLSARAAPALADWLAYLAVDGKAARTLYTYQRELALLLRIHADKDVEDFTAADINETLMRKPERSRYITRSIFNGFFEWALNDERIERNPMVGKVPKMRQPRRRPRDIFSDVERAKLEALPFPHGGLFTIAFGTGLRRGEMRNLRRDSIDLNRARLMVYNGKGNKDRIVPLAPVVLAAIADVDLNETLAADEYLWALVRGPKYQSRRWRKEPIADTTFERWYARSIEAAGVRYLNPHQTRHTFSWWLKSEGWSIEERSVFLGHESTAITERYYGRLTVEDVAEKVAGL